MSEQSAAMVVIDVEIVNEAHDALSLGAASGVRRAARRLHAHRAHRPVSRPVVDVDAVSVGGGARLGPNLEVPRVIALHPSDARFDHAARARPCNALSREATICV